MSCYRLRPGDVVRVEDLARKKPHARYLVGRLLPDDRNPRKVRVRSMRGGFIGAFVELLACGEDALTCEKPPETPVAGGGKKTKAVPWTSDPNRVRYWRWDGSAWQPVQ